MVDIQRHLDKLTHTGSFAADPTTRTGCHVTLNLLYPGVRRVLVSRKLRTHDVAGRATEVWRFHVFNGAVGELCTDQNIRNCGEPKEPQQPMHCGLTVESLLYQTLLNLTLAQIDAGRNQQQTREEHYRNDQEDDDPGVRGYQRGPSGV